MDVLKLAEEVPIVIYINKWLCVKIDSDEYLRTPVCVWEG